MRVSFTKRAVVAIAAALTLTVALASPASANTRTFDATGSITIGTFPPRVDPIGEGNPHPCESAFYRVTLTTAGTATTGTVRFGFSLQSLFFPKPVVSPTVYDEIRISVLFEDLVYNQIGTSNDYDISGTAGLQWDIFNIDEETCFKTNYKCTFAMVLDFAGSTLSNTQPLPTIGPAGWATASLVATTDSPDGIPLTYLGGDCEEYLIFDWVHVDLDLTLVRV